MKIQEPTASSRTSPDSAAIAAMGQIARGLLAQQGGDVRFDTLKRGVRELVARDPMDTAMATVLGGAYLFYIAEKGTNPKVQSFWDALVFVSTSMSVGYSNIFPTTSGGKAIASFLMTVGPKFSAAMFDPPAAERTDPAAESVAVQKAIVERLDAILTRLDEAKTP